MRSLDQVLDAMLHDRDMLAAFMRDDRSVLQVSDSDFEAMQTIDRNQLTQAHQRIRSGILQRSHRGAGSISTLFPKTIAAWTDSPNELAAYFLASDAHAQHREVPHAGTGTCLEEAFYRFAEGRHIGDPAEREREFLHAMARALTLSPDPAFAVPPEFQRRKEGWVGVTRRSSPTLFAATPRGLVTGPLH